MKIISHLNKKYTEVVPPDYIRKQIVDNTIKKQKQKQKEAGLKSGTHKNQ